MTGRIIFDLTSAARWTGPPVGIIRAQRELALFARRERPETLFAVFDPRTMAYRAANPAWIDAILAGEASFDAWALPDPTGGRRRRSERVPRPLYAILQARRTALRGLETLRLTSTWRRLGALADRAQRALITPRYAPAMLNEDGSRRAFLPPDLLMGQPLTLSGDDTLVCTGVGWGHSNIEAIAAARGAAGFRLAVMCYDLIPLLFPHFFKPHDVARMRRYWRLVFPTADMVVANSEATARDAREWCADQGLRCAPIVVVPLGSDPSPMREPSTRPPPDGLEAGRYALFVSTIEPRKGHEMLVRVWARLLAEGVPQRRRFKLVFVGRPGWMTEALQARLLGDAALKQSVLTLQDLEDVDLDALYRCAAFCLYPSIYEGYGLPIAEAFARGKAVLASGGGALAELAAGFSPVLDPMDEAAWLEALRRWIEDPGARATYEAKIQAFSPPRWSEVGARFFDAVCEPACVRGPRSNQLQEAP